MVVVETSTEASVRWTLTRMVVLRVGEGDAWNIDEVVSFVIVALGI